MDQLSLVHSKKQLSSLFDVRFRNLKIFLLVAENKQLLILITSFLSIADILKLSVGSKQLHKIIQCNSQIQNRVLKAQVAYLTKEQQRKIETSPLYNTLNKSAYSMFQSYWDNTPVHIDQRLKKLQRGQIKLANSPYSFILSMLIPKSTKEKIKKNSKQLTKQTQKKVGESNYNQSKKKNQKTISSSSQDFAQQQAYENELIENDRELQLLTKWQKQAKQMSYEQKMKRLVKMTKQERRKLIIQNFKERNIPYQEVAPPDKSLIITEVTFWDRIKNKLTPKN